MTDTKNGALPPTARPPVRLEVRLGSPLGLDPKTRMAVFEAVNDVLLDRYQVGIPLAVLKAVVGQAIATEAENEAKARSGTVTVPNLKLVRPT